MNHKLHELVSVDSTFDHKKLLFYPKLVSWNSHTYEINKIGLHHTYRKGDVLYHVFSVATETSYLRLVFNSRNLNWHLEEISDGF